MTDTGISYLVIDEDPNSEDFETVFEVLGVRLDTDGTWTVGLRNRRTNETHTMTSRAMTVSRRFRALPLDQVSQDRKDARDRFDTQITDPRTGEIWNTAGTAYGEDGVTAVGVWVEDGIEADHVIKYFDQFGGPAIGEYDVVAYPEQPAPVEYRVLDTATGRRFAVLGTTAEGRFRDHIWLRALDTHQIERMWTSTFTVMRDFVAVCNHGYGQRDSCPGCDHDQEMAQAARTFDELKSTQLGMTVEQATAGVGSPLFDALKRADSVMPSVAEDHIHQVAEMCGISDAECASVMASVERAVHAVESTDRALGRALYFLRELLDPTGEDLSVTARARAFLAELDAQ